MVVPTNPPYGRFAGVFASASSMMMTEDAKFALGF